MLERLKNKGFDVISVGKINDIFAGVGVTESNPTVSNADGMDKTLAIANRDFSGLCFVNLVDFDMVFGHRNDVDGYARALTEFDARLGELLPILRNDDLLVITADHGCDPSTPSTDHSREYVPLLVYSKSGSYGKDLGVMQGFGHVADIVESYLGDK
jgi:phosphopentomutase